MQFLMALFASGGAVGFGAVLKGIFGTIQCIQDRKAESAKLEGLGRIRESEVALKFLDSQFGETPNGTFAVHTRRMLALIGVGTLAISCLHCLACYDGEIITLPSTARGGESSNWSFLWGLVTIPQSDKPISLTLGHVSIGIITGFQIILGFYFGPGGRR